MRPIISTGILAIAAVGMFVLPGCGDNRPPAPEQKPVTDVASLPDWVQDPTMGGKYPLAAAGIQHKMLGGFASQRDNALTNARKELARVIDVKVQSVAKQWTREGGEITSQDNKSMAMQMFEDTTRQITNQNVQGTPQRALFQDKTTGDLFVWVYVDPAATAQINAAIKSQAREQMEKRAHFAAKVEMDKAMEDLDKLVDKEMGPAK